MSTQTSCLVACHFSLYLIASATFAADVDAKKPKSTADVPSIKAPVPTLQSSQPKVKLNDDTMNAISEPLSPSAKPPQKTVQPEHVPKSISEPGKASASTKPASAPPVSTPDIPKSPATAAIQKPQLDNRQLQQIRQLQQSAAALGRVQQVRPGEQAGGLSDQQIVDPATGTALEGKGISTEAMNERLRKADELVHDLMYGRGGSFNADPSTYLGANPDRGPKTFTGPDNPSDALNTSRTGLVSDETHKGNNVATTITEEAEDDSGQTITTTDQVDGDTGEQSHTQTITDSDGNTLSVDRTTYDADGNVTGDYFVRYVEQDGQRYSVSGGTGRETRVRPLGPVSDRQPNEVAPSNYGNCNPVTGINCGKGGVEDPMAKISQPVHGDEVANLRGAGSSHPNAGPEAVTNPGEGSSGNRGGGGGFKPPGGTPINPDPVPAPGGAGSDASIDAALEGLEAPGAD